MQFESAADTIRVDLAAPLDQRAGWEVCGGFARLHPSKTQSEAAMRAEA
jgi:hypothetical protein